MTRSNKIPQYLRFLFLALIIHMLMILTLLPGLAYETVLKEKVSINSNIGVCTGYTLISPFGKYPYLIDMNGVQIHNWSVYGIPAKMLPNGSVMGVYEVSVNPNKLIRGGGVCKHVLEENWTGNVTWEFHNWSEGWARQHHDFCRIGNPEYYSPVQKTKIMGNTLILARSLKTVNRSLSWMPLEDGVIYEVNYKGELTGFEWYAHEHFNDMGFDKRAKFGIYLFPAPMGWLHLNSCSTVGENKWFEQGYGEFNPDNIITCSRHANFVAIINKTDGRIVWRVGPDYTKEPDDKLGQIIAPHNAHIIPKGLPGEGNMLLFDNGGISGYGILGGLFYLPSRHIRFYSRIIEFNPITKEIVWEYVNRSKGLFSLFDKNKFFSATISSVQRLPNGNTMITEGTSGRIFEVTPEKEIVWDYCYSPTDKTYRNCYIYRAYRVPPEWVPGNPSNYKLWSSLYEN